jgi:hypothetical protein
LIRILFIIYELNKKLISGLFENNKIELNLLIMSELQYKTPRKLYLDTPSTTINP